MLNGIDPILIFNFFKLAPQSSVVSRIPIVADIINTLALPPIPIYLSETITGIYIDSEEKSIDIETDVDALSSGKDAKINQKALGSTVRINMKGTRDSVGLTLLSSLADLIVPLVTSKEYSITYLHGSVTVFNGLLHSFSVTDNADSDLLNITLEINKTVNKTTTAKDPGSVERIQKPVTLGEGIPPTTPNPGISGGVGPQSPTKPPPSVPLTRG